MKRRGTADDEHGGGTGKGGKGIFGVVGAAGAGGGSAAAAAGMGMVGIAHSPAPSPRLLSAESRLAQEKAWLVDLPQYCHAEVTQASDFVWSFRVSGLHGTLYQVRAFGRACCTLLCGLFRGVWLFLSFCLDILTVFGFMLGAIVVCVVCVRVFVLVGSWKGFVFDEGEEHIWCQQVA